MKKNKWNFLFILFSIVATGQNNQFFSEINVTYKVKETYNWLYKVSPTWKHVYDDVGWRRFGVNLEVDRKLDVWTLMGGAVNSYTFNPKIENYYEFRPWVGISLKTRITNRFTFKQRVKAEWRNLIFSHDYEDEKNDRSYGRMRYQIGLDIFLVDNIIEQNDLNLHVFNEWYYLKNASTGERFANSSLFGLKFTYDFSKERTIGLGYKVEDFFESSNTPDRKGHTIFLEYIF